MKCKICGVSFQVVGDIFIENVCDSCSKEIYEKEKRVQFVKNIAKGKKVLDVGCDFGTLHDSINDVALDLYGIDVKIQKIKNNICQADANQYLPFKKNSFDCIVACEVIEHIKNYKLFIKESFRLLRKGGLLVITTPNKNSLINRLTKSYEHLKYKNNKNGSPRLHQHLFIKDELFLLLNNNGFKITKFFCLPYTFNNKFSLLRKIIHHFLPYSLQENMIIVAKKILINFFHSQEPSHEFPDS